MGGVGGAGNVLETSNLSICAVPHPGESHGPQASPVLDLVNSGFKFLINLC